VLDIVFPYASLLAVLWRLCIMLMLLLLIDCLITEQLTDIA